MNVLLDTCALLALAGGELPDGAAVALRRAPEAYVSVVSPWEVAIMVAGGKLQLQEPPI
jgi:PIN domain nuclease of toxin-antitoxin system